MKESFKYMMIEPFTNKDWKTGWFLGVLAWLSLLTIAGLIMCNVLSGINRIGRQEYKGEAVIINKRFIPAHSESYGKGQTKWVDDEWLLYIEKDKISNCIYVSHSIFNKTRNGDKCCIKYYTGRLWKSLYIVSLCSM